MDLLGSHPLAWAWAGRSLSALVTLAILADAAHLVLARAATKAQLAATGFADTAAGPLAAITLACAVLYAIPQTAVLGAVLITGFLGGAICTHFRLGAFGSPPQLISLALGVMTWAGLYLQDAQVRSLLPFVG
jgi:hypothetical protein